jgi:glycosyltransferase involved in cell wall biosynthesis
MGIAEPCRHAKISVIIPTYKRPQQLYVCLSALTRQCYPFNRYEVIVVNDGGTSLSPLIKLIENRLEIVLIEQSNTGPAQARNHGALVAHGELLAFTDDDCLPSPDWLRQLNMQHRKTPGALLGGKTMNFLSENPYSATSQMIIDVAYEHYNNSPRGCVFFASNNMAIPRADFMKIGGFHPRLRTSEDREFCDRWLATGRSMKYVESAVIEHSHFLTFNTFLWQHFCYGRGALHFYRCAMQQRRLHHGPNLHFQRKLLEAPFKRASGIRSLTNTALLCLSQIASLAGYLHAQGSLLLYPETWGEGTLRPLTSASDGETLGTENEPTA